MITKYPRAVPRVCGRALRRPGLRTVGVALGMLGIVGTITVGHIGSGVAGPGIGVAAVADTSGTATAVSASTTQTVRPIVTDILDTMAAQGSNGCSGKQQGLLVNWRYGTDQVNLGSGGAPDANRCARHDRLTDLRYLHNLLHYRQLYCDHRYDAAITRYTAIVKADFAKPAEQRGWVYFEFKQLAALDPDPFWAITASKLAHSWSAAPDAKVLAIRGDWAVEQASALIAAGDKTGTARLGAAWHAFFNPTAGLVTSQGGQVKLGEVGQEVEALAWAGQNQKAAQLLTGANRIRDTAHGGYFFKADVTAGGAVTVDTSKKEGGRQAEMLFAAHLSGDNTLKNQLFPVVTTKVYQKQLHGVLYEQAPDWSVRRLPGGGPEDWITTEAMGITVNALLSVADAKDPTAISAPVRGCAAAGS